MNVATRIEIADDTSIIQAMSQLLLEGSRKAEFMDSIGAALVSGASLRFPEGVDPDGMPWQQSIRAKEQGGETMRDKGRLMASLSHNVLSDDEVEYGTNLQYGHALHFGALIKPVNGDFLTFKIGARWVRVKQVLLPARPFLGVSKEDEIEVMNIINIFLGQAT